jgi:DNA-binding HxlR family transcriptional regulator
VSGERWVEADCPIARTLGVVGTRSAMLIVREAFYGTTHFDDFAARIGFSEAITATRLRELTAAGLLERRTSRGGGGRTGRGYRLTEAGRELAPVILGLHRWGVRHLSEDPSAPPPLTHRDCGAALEVTISCAAGHQLETAELAGCAPFVPTGGAPTGQATKQTQ